MYWPYILVAFYGLHPLLSWNWKSIILIPLVPGGYLLWAILEVRVAQMDLSYDPDLFSWYALYYMNLSFWSFLFGCGVRCVGFLLQWIGWPRAYVLLPEVTMLGSVFVFLYYLGFVLPSITCPSACGY